MVEWRLLPRPVVVALFALRSLLPSMFVVFLVAGITVHRSVFITIVRMAADAGDFDVLVAQLVACLVMVEADLLPIPIRMTVDAGVSQLAFMFVVFLMAAVTI